jgi:protein-S-isoprenylcysteine O-methyltransferase Ste14
MKLVALTYGTEGDTRPIASLCRALMDAGYEVTLLADGGTLGSARDLGVPHAALAGDIRGTLQSVSGISSAGKNSLNAAAKAVAHIANENADAWMRQVLDVAAGSDGLIVAGLAAFIGFSAAEKLAVPVIGGGMIPLSPTSAFPSPFLPPRSMPRWLNRVPALDHRYGWSTVPAALSVGAELVFLGSFAYILRVFRANSFAATTVTVAPNQRVVSTGPYAHVRHPMYAAGLVLLATQPLSLGSWWGLLVMIPLVLIIVWRLLDEEAFLTANLAGYAEYRKRVRFRLVPFVW